MGQPRDQFSHRKHIWKIYSRRKRDIYFIGGFGTVAWVDVKEYETLQPDKIAVDGGEQYLKVNFLISYSGS